MQIVGHRGAMGLAPANTLQSIKKALEYNVDEIELDVRVTKDKIPILFHDYKLKDQNENSLIIKNTTLAELLQHKADITTLSEAMTVLANNKTRLLLDIKPKEDLKPIKLIINSQLANGWDSQNLSISSFSYTLLKQIKTTLPNVQLVVNEPWSGVRAHYRAKRLKTNRMNMKQIWLWSVYVKPSAKRGYKIYAYPLNNPSRANKMADYGLAGVITDYPNRYKTTKG